MVILGPDIGKGGEYDLKGSFSHIRQDREKQAYVVDRTETTALPASVQPTTRGLLFIPPPRLFPIQPTLAGAVKIPMNSSLGVEGNRYPQPMSRVGLWNRWKQTLDNGSHHGSAI
jgi:hypothetical protein